MRTITLCEWSGALLNLVGAYAISGKHAWGIPFFLVANICFLAVAKDRRLWGIFALQFAYMAINFRALYVWSRP